MSIKEIFCEDLKNRESNDCLLVDVRSPEEFTGGLGHIKGSKLITLGDDLENYKNSLKDKNQKIVFICRSGNRSGKATENFTDDGFTNCFNMIGGMIEWNSLGFEVEK